MKRMLMLLFTLALTACLTIPTGTASPSTALPSPAPALSGTPTVTVTATLTACRVTASALHVRQGAGVEYAVIGWLTRGEIVTVLEAGAWLNVMTDDGVTGYINAKYCKDEKAVTGSHP